MRNTQRLNASTSKLLTSHDSRFTFSHLLLSLSMNSTKAISLSILLSTFTISAWAQPKKGTAPSATVNVVVTNMNHAPRKGEEVLFVSERTRQQFAGKTNASGKASFALATGDAYQIKLKTLNDTTSYSRIEIPALEPGQYFDAPFTVDIEYEPSRTYTLDNVHFDTGKPTLRPDSYKELNEIAAYLALKEEQRIEISGHTDNRGIAADNLKLSQARANSVKTYLVRKGIGANRIIAKGYGDAKPIADNASEEGRQKNRRTEVTLL